MEQKRKTTAIILGVIAVVVIVVVVIMVLGNNKEFTKNVITSKDGKFTSTQLAKNISDPTFVVTDIDTDYLDGKGFKIELYAQPSSNLKLAKEGFKLDVFKILQNIQNTDDYKIYNEIVIVLSSDVMDTKGNKTEEVVLTSTWDTKTIEKMDFDKLNYDNYINNAKTFQWLQAYEK